MLTILPMPANMSRNSFFLPGVVTYGALVGSHLANLSKVAQIEAISVFVNLKFTPSYTPLDSIPLCLSQLGVSMCFLYVVYCSQKSSFYSLKTLV